MLLVLGVLQSERDIPVPHNSRVPDFPYEWSIFAAITQAFWSPVHYCSDDRDSSYTLSLTQQDF